MKKILTIIAIAIIAATSLYSQDFKKEGTVYSPVEKESTKTEEKTGFSYQDKNGVTYDIYIGKSGACYIKKVSKKSGNEYNQYLGEEISRDICKSLGREYTAKSKLSK